MNDTTIEGSCTCGKVQFKAKGSALAHFLCHCHSCQRASSAPLLQIAMFPAEAFECTGSVEAFTITDSSKACKRWQCSECGTRIFNEPMENLRCIFPALCTEKNWFKPEMHLHWSERLVNIEDELPKYLDFPKQYGGTGNLA